jgi:hypothetical protein
VAEPEKSPVWIYSAKLHVGGIDVRATFDPGVAEMFRQSEGYEVGEYVPASQLEELREGARAEIERLKREVYELGLGNAYELADDPRREILARLEALPSMDGGF